MTNHGFTALGDALRSIGYTTDGMASRFGPHFAPAAFSSGVEFARAEVRQAAAGDELAAVTAAFMLGMAVDAGELTRVVGERAASALAELGSRNGSEYTASFSVVPLGDEWLVVSDFGDSIRGQALDPGHVVGAGGASETLAQITPRTPVESVWDMGSGCGVQAVYAAQNAHRVVATDVSERAVWCTEVSATLSGVSVDARVGSFAEPVATERFDRIVANPPFVITARDAGLPRYTYRDAGLAGDALLDHLVATLPQHLNPGGSAHLLANWELPAGAQTSEVLAERFASAECDVWVIERETQASDEYVQWWMRDSGSHRSADAGQVYRAWRDDFVARGVERIGFGFVMLYPKGEVGCSRFERATGPLEGDVGSALAVARAGAAAFAQASTTQRLELTPRIAADVVQASYGEPGAGEPLRIELLGRAGLHRSMVVDPAMAGAAGAFDGTLTVGQVAAGVAALTGVQADQMAAAVLNLVDSLLWSGMLNVDVAGAAASKMIEEN